MRILITGVTGFAGGHLAEALLPGSGVRLFGASRRTQWPAELRHLAAHVELHGCDLDDLTAVESLLRRVKPEQIYHLAGYAQTGRVFWDADVVWASNLTATRRLYEAVVRWGGQPRILYVSSGMVYGNNDRPNQGHAEHGELRPTSPYGASKAAADLLSFQMTRDPGLNIVRARPFNHIGSRQSADYAVAHFAQQIAAIEAGAVPAVVETGNLESWRDLADVRDVVRAYQLLMDRGKIGEAYNIGSGQCHAMQAVLDQMVRMARCPVEIRPRPDTRRGAAPAVLRADIHKLSTEFGWTPHVSLETSLGDILDYWRGRIAHPAARAS